MRLFLALAFVAAASALSAQVPVVPALPLMRPGTVVTGSAVAKSAPAKIGTPAEAPAEAAEVKVPEKPKASPRLEKLKTITFDRRPSALLKSWAPEVKKDAPGFSMLANEAENLEAELANFRKAVGLGNWPAVKAYISSLPDEEAIAAYRQLLVSLQQAPRPNMNQGMEDDGGGRFIPPGAQRFAERNQFTLDDLLGIAAAAPAGTNAKLTEPRAALIGLPLVVALAPDGLQKAQIQGLAGILRETIDGGTLSEVAAARFKVEAAKPQPVLPKRIFAKMLIGAGQGSFAGDFLPTPETALAEKDYEALNLLSVHFLALQSREEKAGSLEKAWNAVQAVLSVPDGTKEQQEEALMRAVDLAPRIADRLGQGWLDESFTKKTDRGMTILATIGTLVSQGISTRPFQPDDRINTLKLLKTAVEAALKASPEKAKEWQATLTVLALAWYKEAEFSRVYDRSSGSGPRIRRDVYGNIFYSSNDDDDGMNRMMMMNNGNMPRPIALGDVLRARPNDAWVAAVDDSIRPRIADLLARMHLKVNEEDKAFPLIAELAKAQPEEARELVKEFVRVWTRNHDPNGARNENRYSWFFFSFEQRAEGIPLTRSKQERNLAELAEWLENIRKLPIRPLDDAAVVKAFTACHSSAEVYRLEAIAKVFGPMEKLQPRTLAGLAEQMRTNLAGLWRDDRTQTAKQTNRKKKDLEAEVVRGYEVARGVVSAGLKQYPNHYALLAADASLIHDEINYRQELSKSTDFSKLRDVAFAKYAQAAAEYGKLVKTIREEDQNNDLFNAWFAASLGAVDLGNITEEKQPDLRQPAKIRSAFAALPGEAATKHLDRFANDLFTKLSGAKPHVKFRYLKSGFEIVGDHKQAVEAKKLFDYYQDLVKEIKLDVVVDGSTRLGHGRAFGAFVNLNHTRDIERESGGFGRYLQNQNGMSYSYNYGRPTTDYRDRFEQASREALKEHFDVISVTFQEEKVTSRAAAEFGWRYTPYAYILMKPRGPQVDKIPELRIDMDFLDTSGFVVLPVNSRTVPIDARDPKGDARPIDDLVVTQTLDERQADKGILLLEIKAAGYGLIPDLGEMAGTVPDGFEVTKTDDPGVSVKKFAEDPSVNAVLCERVWTLTLKGKSGQDELPKSFRFPSVSLPTKELLHQRYNDADLMPVEQLIALEKTYGRKSNFLLYCLIAGSVLGLSVVGGLIVLVRSLRSAPSIVESKLPATLTPFTVVGFLEKLKASGRVSAANVPELDRDLARIQDFHYGDADTADQPDLGKIAEKWVQYA